MCNSEYWDNTLLMVTFDEHGGTYDHVPPPSNATPPGLSGPPPLPGGECGFQFDRFGVRVPTIMISPWIKKHTVFRSLTDDIHRPQRNGSYRTPYDHTSTLKSVLNWDRFGIQVDEKKFGGRVANAPTFESVLNVPGESARTDIPKSLPDPHFKVDKKRAVAFSALQTHVLPIIVALIDDGIAIEEALEKADKILGKAKHLSDIHKAISKLVRG